MRKIVRTSLLAGAATLSLFAAQDRAGAHAGCPELPRLLSYGGPVVASPRYVPITFASDALGSQVQDFVAKLGPSKFLASAVAEYGVGPGSAAPAVMLDEAPPAKITDVQIQAWLSGKIASGALAAPDAGTVYVVAFPDATEVDLDPGYGYTYPVCSFGMHAFHESFVAPSGAPVPFVVSPRCGPVLGLSGIDAVTVPLSAEMVGATTNPQPSNPAWAGPDFAGSSWAFFGAGGEAGEICEAQPGGFSTLPEIGYAVSHVWSNRAAAARRDPCAPGASRAYFNAMPKADGAEPYPGNDVSGLTIAPGGSVTIPIHLFGHPSEGCTWQLSASTAIGPYGTTDPNGVLSFSFDQTTGEDGDVRWLTVKRAAQSGPPMGLGFAIVSTAGSETHEWLLGVGP